MQTGRKGGHEPPGREIKMKLALDIVQYVENADPFEFRDIYENTADAIRDITLLLQTSPEHLIDYFAGILVNLEYYIETEQNADIKEDLDREYAQVSALIDRIKMEGGHAA